MKRKLIALSLTLMTAFGMTIAVTSPALALFEDSKQEACAGIQLSDSATCDAKAGDKANNLLATGINILSFVVAVAAVIAIIIGGLRYVTSAGDSNSVNGAKNTILYAIIGLVVVAMAQIIVKFVLNRAA